MDNRYYYKNRRKHNLKVHIILVTKFRKQLLEGNIAKYVKQEISWFCNRKNYEIIAMETDKDHIHVLLEYDTTVRVCDIVKQIKQETTTYGGNTQTIYLNNIGKRKFFGLMDILHVVLVRFRQLQ